MITLCRCCMFLSHDLGGETMGSSNPQIYISIRAHLPSLVEWLVHWSQQQVCQPFIVADVHSFPRLLRECNSSISISLVCSFLSSVWINFDELIT